MTGNWWRLLAALWLIFVAPVFLRGQDAAVDGAPVAAPNVAADVAGLRYVVPSARLPVPVSPHLSKAYPVSSGTIVLGQIVFRQIVHPAGIIFCGRVIFVGHSGAPPGRDPVSTTVTFQVEHAIRGTASGEQLTIHEWAGLWARGERYRVGERVLLFLYGPSKLGLTSPAGGAMGRFAVNSEGKIVMSPQHIAIFAADPILGGRTVVPYNDFLLAMRSMQPPGVNEP